MAALPRRRRTPRSRLTPEEPRTPSGLTAEEYTRRYMNRPMREDDPLYNLPSEQAESLIDSWADPAGPLSTHLDLAIAAAFHRRDRNLPPLRDGEPIPGCDCPDCTGVPADAPVRVVPIKSRYRRAAYRPPLDVEGARAVPVVEIAERLGLDPVQPYRGAREYVVRCPFHPDNRPSLRLNPAKNVWFCSPCNTGGDGIKLYQRVRGIDFPEAVRELAA